LIPSTEVVTNPNLPIFNWFRSDFWWRRLGQSSLQQRRNLRDGAGISAGYYL